MGNAPSQQHQQPPHMSDAATQSLSRRGQQRLSQNPHNPYVNFFEMAAATHDPVVNRAPKKKQGSRSGSTSGSSSVASSSMADSSTASVNRTPRQSATTSDTASTLVSHDSAQHFEYHNGRKYLSYPPSIRRYLPCDDDESDRIVIMHFLLKYAFDNQNLIAPAILDKAYVLDIGCGPGTWVLEMASEFPSCEFHGIDLCTMFPTSIKPQNARFTQHDFLERLPFPDNTFDYIHMRSMLCSLTRQQLNRLLREISRVLKPLGYIEIVDVEYRVQRAGPIAEEYLNQKLSDAMFMSGIDFSQSYHLSTMLMTSHFVNVHQSRVTIPLGWGGQLGRIHGQSMHAFYRSLHPTIRKRAHLNNDILDQIMHECEKFQSHLNWYACFGQKPLPDPLPSPALTEVVAGPTTAVPPSVVGDDVTWESINDFVDGYVE